MNSSLGGRRTILIVDDQPTNIDVLYGILQAEYRVKVALDGKQALALAAADPPPDLILLDIMMPDLDGYEVCRRLKANPFTRPIPIIFVTAMSDVVDESRGFELGAVDYITKPISPALVRARIRTQVALYDQNRSLEEMVRQRTAELQRAYQQLLQERSRFEWMVQNAEDGYLMLDKNGYILFANPRARQYLNITPEQALPSARFIELVRRQYRAESREAWEAPLAQAGTPPRYLVRPETPTAKDFWLQVDIFEMSSESKEKTLIVQLRDVTEQVGSARERGAFTMMIHHKMRTPLGTLVGSMDLLIYHAAEMSPEEIAENAERAHKGARRLQSTIEDILSYLDAPSQIKAGERFPLVQLGSLVSDISRSLEIEHVSLECPDDLHTVKLFFTQRAMELVLWEVLENAHKFHPHKAPHVNIRVALTYTRMVGIQISDDGISLSPEHLTQLWRPFYQGEKSFTGELPGTGLGLALVSSLVLGVGGSCHAYNRDDGPGIIIDILLPLAE